MGHGVQRLLKDGVVLLLAVSAAFAQETLAERAPAAITLAPGEWREFTVHASGPRFLRVTVTQQTAQFRLVLSGPQGKLGEYASRDFSRIRTARVLEQPGDYRLRVELAPSMSRSGICNIVIDDFRAPEADDRALEDGYRSFWDGYMADQAPWAAPGKPDVLRPIIEALKTARDAEGEANALLILAGLLKSTDAGESSYARASALYRESGDLFGECRAELGLAWTAKSWDPAVVQKTLSRLAGASNDWYRAHLLFELGNLHEYYDHGRFEQAIGSLSQAGDLFRSTGDRHWLGRSLLRLGTIDVQDGLYDEAVTAFSESVEVLSEIKDPFRARSVQGLARVYNLFLMDKQKALDIYRGELDRAAKAGEIPIVTSTLSTIASIYGGMGRSRDALDALLRIEQLEKEQGRKGLNVTLQSQIAATRSATGDKEGSAAIRRRLPEEFQKTMQPTAPTGEWIRLSNFRRGAGDWEGAREAMEEALTRERKTSTRFNEAPALGGLAEIAQHSGNLAAAIEYSEQAYSAARRLGSINPLVLAGYPEALARLYLRAGENSKALEAARDALRLAGEAKDREAQARVLVLTARCERVLGRLDDAASDLERALGNVESIRSQLQNEELRSSYFAQRYGLYDAYIDLLMALDAARPGHGFAARALDASERGRARLLLEMLREGNADIRSGVDPALLQKKTTLERQLTSRMNAETALLGRKHTQKEAEEAALQVRVVTAELHNAEADIRTHSPRYASLTQPEPLTTNEIQSRLLDPQTVLLEYWIGQDRSFLWAVTSESVHAWELPARDVLAGQTRSYYDLLTARGQRRKETPEQRRARVEAADRKLQSAGPELSKVLLGQAAGAIRGRRIAVVRGDALQMIPFSALPDPEHPALPLVAGHEVVALPSASALGVLRRQTESRPEPRNLVAVVADPVFDTNDPRLAAKLGKGQKGLLPAGLERSASDAGIMRDGGLPRLPASRIEANAIATAAPRGGAWEILDFDASRGTVTGPKLSGYRIVHFASHALLNNETPELSGIVLSLVDRKGAAQDGYLRLQDIYNLNLPADLVVLSACQTGLGKEVRGEGLVGLTRGFFYAGAKRVVSSLWKVDDAATARLMAAFYSAMLRAGLSPSAALRQAELQLSRQPLWQSPYYWAAFELQGEWR